MNLDPFYTFLAFVAQDAHILSRSKKIDSLFIERKYLLERLEGLQRSLHNAQENVHTAKKNLDAQELEIKILHERQRSLKNKINSVSSPKEYFSLEAELKTIATEIDVQEDKLFALFEAHESLEKQLEQVSFDTVILQEQIDKDVIAIDQQIESIISEKIKHESLYHELESNVNPEMLEKFLSMKRTFENPVVVVDKNACSACFNTISVQEMVSLRKHRLISCQNCFRLLYSVES